MIGGDTTRRILICGTGRAGTTLLVRILGRAGLDTGFSDDDIAKVEANVGRAGLEHRLTASNANELPLVVKTPHAVNVIPQLLADKWFEIGLAIIPMRDLWAAAESRRQVKDRAIEAGLPPARAPGGLWKTRDGMRQENVLAEQFYRTLEPLVTANVPLKLLAFPRFARDREYFLETLGGVLSQKFGVTEAALRDAHDKEVDQKLITIEASQGE